MYLLRYVVSRIFVFWLSIAILIYGWFSNPQLVNTGFGVSEMLIKNLTTLEASGKAETVAVQLLHAGDLIVIGAIMLVVTLVFTALRNLVLGSGERRMTVMRAIGQVVVLLLLSYAVLAAVWWHDARLVNSWFDASRALIVQAAAAIDPGGRMELVFRTLGLARHLVVGCIMLALALAWEMLKWAGRGGRTLAARG
ncbi:MAG: hypothetical protein QOF09_1926 [Alphaproteobacteria bacterium]|jgi:hypothetical protein|nr:hypothetical protein [Alphaproteobacteria bacterium]